MKTIFRFFAAFLFAVNALAQTRTVTVNPNTNALASPSASAFRNANGLQLGVDIQAFSAKLSQIASLADPDADAILFWDDSASAWSQLSLGTGLAITSTTLDVTGSVVRTGNSYENPSWITSLSWGKITSPPTTLSGYGVTAITGDIITSGTVADARIASTIARDSEVLAARNYIDATDAAYGAVGDGGYGWDGAITSGAAILTGANFAVGDVGKTIRVYGAGAAGGTLTTTISGYTNSTTVTLADDASTTVSDAGYQYGTDNTTALQNALDAAGASTTAKTVRVPPGYFLITGMLTRPDHVQIIGAGRGGLGLGGHSSGRPVSAILSIAGSFHAIYSATPFGLVIKDLGIIGAGKSRSTGDGVRIASSPTTDGTYPGSLGQLEGVYIHGFARNLSARAFPDLQLTNCLISAGTSDLYLHPATGLPSDGFVFSATSTGGGGSGSTIFDLGVVRGGGVYGGNHNIAEHLAALENCNIVFEALNSEQITGAYRIGATASIVELRNARATNDANPDTTLVRLMDNSSGATIRNVSLDAITFHDGYGQRLVDVGSEVAARNVALEQAGAIAIYTGTDFTAIKRHEVVIPPRPGVDRWKRFSDHFLSNPGLTATPALYGEKGWHRTDIVGSGAAFQVSHTQPFGGNIAFLSGDTEGDFSALEIADATTNGISGLGNAATGWHEWDVEFEFRPWGADLAGIVRAGLMNSGSDPTDGIFVDFDDDDDDTIKFVCRSSSTSTTADSGYTPTQDPIHVRMRSVISGHVIFTINGAHEIVIKTNVPNAILRPRFISGRNSTTRGFIAVLSWDMAMNLAR